jgi:hypothetical protein
MQLEGLVNVDADWTDFTVRVPAAERKTVSMTALFSFAEATEAELALTPNTDAFGFLGHAASGPRLPGFRNPGRVSDLNGGTVSTTVGTAHTAVAFNFNGMTPTNVTNNGAGFTPPAGTFNTTANTITFAAWTSASARTIQFRLAGETPPRTYTIVFNVTAS